MKRLKELKESNKQLVKFGFIGVLAVLTDLACYWAFLNLLPENALPGGLGNEPLAKTLSFLCGLSVTYYFNKRWTWRRRDRNDRRLAKFLLTYGISLILNVGINSGLLYGMTIEPFTDIPNQYLVAFIGATGICSAFNFVGQKFWIFNSDPILEAVRGE